MRYVRIRNEGRRVNVTVNWDSLQLERVLKTRDSVGKYCLQIFAQNIELSFCGVFTCLWV